MPSKLKKPIKLDHDGDLLIDERDGSLLGHLFDAGPDGVFDPRHGQVAVPLEKVKAHNAALDAALLAGLDTCKVGEHGTFYLDKVPEGGYRVITWGGTLVSNDVTHEHGRTYTFRRDGREFRGQLDVQLLQFKRTV